jgi:orotate phosphoribosyltransferase
MKPTALHEDEALDIVRQCGALLHGHFVGTQEEPGQPGAKGYGLHIPIYLDGRVLITKPRETERLGAAIASLLVHYEAEVVVGMPIGAYTVGHEVAKALGIDFAMAEKIDGQVLVNRPAFKAVVEGRRVLIVDDTVSDGDTLQKGVDGVLACGGILTAIGCTFDRGRVDPRRFDAPFRPLIRRRLVTLTRSECLTSGQCSRGEPINRTPGHGADLEKLVRQGLVEPRYSFV